jgi:hypothetical protein
VDWSVTAGMDQDIDLLNSTTMILGNSFEKMPKAMQVGVRFGAEWAVAELQGFGVSIA